MTNNCRLHELLLIRGPIFPTNGIYPHPPPRPYNVTPSAPPPSYMKNTSSSTPKRRYSCSKCSYSTDRRDLFTRHENIHRDEKPFRCYVCDKMFNRADHVKKHFLRIHKGIAYDVKLTKRVRGRDYDIKDASSATNITNMFKNSPPQLTNVTMTQPNAAQLSNCFQTNPILSDLLYKRALADTIQIPKIAFNCHNNNNINNNTSKLTQLQYHLQKPLQMNQNEKLENLGDDRNCTIKNNGHSSDLICEHLSILKNNKQCFKKASVHETPDKREDDYQCEYCGCSFVDYPSLHTHRYLLHRYISENDNCLPYKCAVCGQRSVTQRAMMQHMIRHNTPKKKVNDNQSVIRKESVQRKPILSSSNRRKQSQPRKIVKSLEEIVCQPMDLDNKYIIERSMRSKFNCKMCHKEFATYTQLIQHQKFSKH